MTVSPDTARALDGLVTGPGEPGAPAKEGAAGPLDRDGSDVSQITLSEAIAFGLRNNPRLRVAGEAVARARGQEQTAFAPFLPEVDLYTRYGGASPTLSPGAPGPVGGILPSGDGPRGFVQAEVDLQWTVWDFGRTAGRYGQALSRERVAELQLARARQAVAFDVTAAYLSVLRAQAFVRVQELSVRRAEAVRDDARARRQGGVADRNDVLRAEVQLSETQEALVGARQAEYETLAQLNFTLGRNVSLPLRLADWTARPRFALSLPECLETAAAQRQEVGIARETVAAAGYGLDAARGDFLPQVYVRVGVGHVDGEGVRTGFHEGASIHLDHRIYTGGRRQGEQRAAEADVRAAAAGAQTVFDTVTLEVNLAFRGVIATSERIRLTEPTIEQASENLRLVRVKYRNGNATPTDLIDAETAATRSQLRYHAAVYDYLTALARLDYAMGTARTCLLDAPPSSEGAQPEELPPPRPLPDPVAGAPG
jgi:outer membrane protein TolC